MNKIKKIYYPVLAVLTLVAFVLGLTAAVVSFAPKADNTVYTRMKESMNVEHNSYTSSSREGVKSQEDVRNALINNILKNCAAIKEISGASKNNGYESASFGSEGNYSPQYITQNATLSSQSMEDLSTEDELFYADKDVSNIIVAIPGKTQEEAVLFSANYDSAAGSPSATECMQAVALLETCVKYAEEYSRGKIPKKTLLFVITDAEHEGGYGLRAFKNQFEGFDGIAKKVVLAVNFGAAGTGPLAVTSENVSVSKVNGLASGFIDSVSGEFYDYEVYDCAKINVFFGGDKDYIDTPRDNVENLSRSKVDAMCGTMRSLIDGYGYNNFSTGKNVGTFSYLGGTFSYSDIVSYVLGAIAIVLLVVAVVALMRTYKKENILKGAAIQLVTLIATAVILYVCYFLLALILSGFGILQVQTITSIKFMNIGLFVSALLLALTVYIAVFLLLRKFYKVKATDGARGAAFLIGLLGAIMAFAFPSGSMVFVLSSIAESVILILTSTLSKKFKSKYSADIERLFLYFAPIVILTPAVIPVMVTMGYSLALVYFPLILTAAMLGTAVIVPYFATLKPVFEKAVSKLPKHTIRVERTVTEKVEGPKKGRFTEVTHKKVTNEKVEWTYRNRYLLSIVGVLSAILIMLFAACPTRHFSSNAVNEFGFREAVKNDSVVFVWDLEGDTASAAESRLVIYDRIAYKYFDNIDDEYVWNNENKTYEKEFIGDVSSIFGTASPVTASSSSNILTVNPFGNANESFIDLKLTGVEAVTKLIIQASGRRIEIENDGKSVIKLEFPYGDDDYKNFTVEFEIDRELNNDNSYINVGFEFTQYISGNQANRTLSGINDYETLRSEFMSLYSEDMNGGIILHRMGSYRIESGN